MRYIKEYNSKSENLTIESSLDSNYYEGTIYLKLNNDIIGSAEIEYVDKNGEDEYSSDNFIAYEIIISDFIIYKEYRGHSYGIKFITLLLDKLKTNSKYKINRASLYVDNKNEAAINTYLKAGFKLTSDNVDDNYAKYTKNI